MTNAPRTKDVSSRTAQDASSVLEVTQGDEPKQHCGIIMPISSIDECDAAHWARVSRILGEAISKAGFKARLVSAADEVAIIQKTIVQNIFNDEIIVCDISCRNANVMFELGLRLAFDKPVVIVKDEMTPYPFDTGSIEHLTYPRSLSYWDILEFQALLTTKIVSTLSAAKKPGYSPFLRHYGDIKATTLPTTEVSTIEYFEKRFDELSARIETSRIQRPSESTRPSLTQFGERYPFEMTIRGTGRKVPSSTVERILITTKFIRLESFEIHTGHMTASGVGTNRGISSLASSLQELGLEVKYDIRTNNEIAD